MSLFQIKKPTKLTNDMAWSALGMMIIGTFAVILDPVRRPSQRSADDDVWLVSALVAACFSLSGGTK